MKKIFAIFTSILFLVSCTSEEKSVIVRKEVNKTVTSDIKANRIVSMEIEGMTCVMGCGASIRKELFATKAVCSVEFDFEEGRKSNIAEIAFNKDKITVDEIVQLVSKLNDKQFKVGKTSSKEFTCSNPESSCSSNSECTGNKEDCKIKTSTTKIGIPNFLNLLSRFFTR